MPGPQCDMCEDEESVITIMTLADYSTQAVGPNCLVSYFIGALAGLGVPVVPAPQAADSGGQDDAGGQDAEAASPAPVPATGPPAATPARRQRRQAAK